MRIWTSIVLLLASNTWGYTDLEKGIVYFAKQNYSASYQQFKPLALQGNPQAQYYLGWQFANGKGLPQNSHKAIEWYKKSAEQGYPLAQYNLAVLYDKGQGVTQNFQQAFYWYNKAAKQNILRHKIILRYCIEMDRAHHLILHKPFIGTKNLPNRVMPSHNII